MGMAQAERERNIPDGGNSLAKAQRLEGTQGFLGTSSFWRDRRGKSPGLRSLAGSVGPGEGCGLWLRTVGTGEAGVVIAGSLFQTQRESWVPS